MSEPAQKYEKMLFLSKSKILFIAVLNESENLDFHNFLQKKLCHINYTFL